MKVITHEDGCTPSEKLLVEMMSFRQNSRRFNAETMSIQCRNNVDSISIWEKSRSSGRDPRHGSVIRSSVSREPEHWNCCYATTCGGKSFPTRGTWLELEQRSQFNWSRDKHLGMAWRKQRTLTGWAGIHFGRFSLCDCVRRVRMSYRAGLVGIRGRGNGFVWRPTCWFCCFVASIKLGV